MERHRQHRKVTADAQEIVLDSDRGAAGRADAAVLLATLPVSSVVLVF